jgi:hypothetical protein
MGMSGVGSDMAIRSIANTRCFALVLALTGALLNSGRAGAETATPNSDDNRFTCNRVDDGFLRLDMRSGQVSLCRRGADGWSCDIVPDDRGAVDNEITRLRGENAVLKKALLDRGLPLPSGVNTDAACAGSGDRGALQRDARTERVTTLVGQMWRQLVDMFTNLKNVLKKKT